MRIFWLIVFAWAIVASCCAPSQGAMGDPVVATRDALGEVGGDAWYDQQNDAVRPVEPKIDDEPEESGETRQAESSPGGLEFGAWWFLGAVLVALAVVLILVVWQSRNSLGPLRRGRIAPRPIDFEALPVAATAANIDLFEEARRRYEVGDYDGAIVYLYSHLLVQLDRNHFIRLAKGKTNRQYLRELQSGGASLRDIVGEAVVVFERAFFGRRRIERDAFEAVWGRLAEFAAIVERGAL